jgi:hypothetical protein
MIGYMAAARGHGLVIFAVILKQFTALTSARRSEPSQCRSSHVARYVRMDIVRSHSGGDCSGENDRQPPMSDNMPNQLPDNFVSWVITGVGAMIGTLVATVTTLWRLNESKNAKAIEEQARHLIALETQMSLVRSHAEVCEQARIECLEDRAKLATKCEIFEGRLLKLENGSAPAKRGAKPHE